MTRSSVHPRTPERSLHDHRIGLDCRADASYGLKDGHGTDATVQANDHRYLPDIYDMAFIVRTSLSPQRRSRLRVLRLRCAWHHRHCSLRRLTRGGAQLELARHVVHSSRKHKPVTGRYDGMDPLRTACMLHEYSAGRALLLVRRSAAVRRSSNQGEWVACATRSKAEIAAPSCADRLG